MDEKHSPVARDGGTAPSTSGEAPDDATPEERESTADDRDRQAEYRDRSAEGRDRSAEERDRKADESDLRSAGSPAENSHYDQGPDRRAEGAGRRTVDSDAAADRNSAASDRDAASASRRRGARDRTRASDDREAASADRDEAAKDRDVSSMDELTGAYRRGPGMVELEREMSRAKRTRHPFVIGFIDVDGLKARNDSLGHAAGDELLVSVVDALRRQLRSYDLVVRFGGDEFVCGIQDLDKTETAKRLAAVDADLRTRGASITVGLAELGGDDSLSDLIARADEELYAKRSLRPSTRA